MATVATQRMTETEKESDKKCKCEFHNDKNGTESNKYHSFTQHSFLGSPPHSVYVALLYMHVFIWHRQICLNGDSFDLLGFVFFLFILFLSFLFCFFFFILIFVDPNKNKEEKTKTTSKREEARSYGTLLTKLLCRRTVAIVWDSRICYVD